MRAFEHTHAPHCIHFCHHSLSLIRSCTLDFQNETICRTIAFDFVTTIKLICIKKFKNAFPLPNSTIFNSLLTSTIDDKSEDDNSNGDDGDDTLPLCLNSILIHSHSLYLSVSWIIFGFVSIHTYSNMGANNCLLSDWQAFYIILM